MLPYMPGNVFKPGKEACMMHEWQGSPQGGQLLTVTNSAVCTADSVTYLW